jgi:Maleate cis-trans isomerase
MSGAKGNVIWRMTAAMFALALLSAPVGPAVAAEKWDLYVYNPVSTVAAVKGLNTVIEQIEKETGGELSIRLHLGGSLPINTTTITQAVSDDVVQMGDDGYFLGNVPIGGVLRLPMLLRTLADYDKAAAIMNPYLEKAFEKKGLLVRLEAASELLADACVEVIVFHCTAVSTFAPDLAHGIRERIERASGIRCFTTADAILAALSKLNVKRISLLTPYIDEVHAREMAWLEASGVNVEEGGVNLGINTNTDMAKLQPEEILDWARKNISDAADVCFLSCTAIKSAAIIEPLERICGRPILTSNQGMVWHLLRSSNIFDSVASFGQLLESRERGAVSA